MTQGLWQVFTETGDPLCYLLYKADSKKQPALQSPHEDRSVPAAQVRGLRTDAAPSG